METKNLEINGKTYARYEISNNILFIKVDIEIIEGDQGASENLFVYLIQLIEKVPFRGTSYLNI